MSDSQTTEPTPEQKHLIQQGEIVTDLFMRVAVMERLLIQKNLFTQEEMTEALKSLSDELMDAVKRNLEAQGVRVD